MKPFWVSCLILATLVVILQANAFYLKSMVDPLQEQLTRAAEFVDADDWETAIELTKEVQQIWHDKKMYLHVTLRHVDINQIYIHLEEALAYLDKRDIAEYAASNQALINQLGLLYEMERLTLQNVL